MNRLERPIKNSTDHTQTPAPGDVVPTWATAATLREIGALTVRWLDDDLPTCPSYGGPPDPETLEDPELMAALRALNAAGFVTDCSQPGCDVDDGDHWVQRAGISMFCPAEHVEALWMAMALGSGMAVCTSPNDSVPVTVLNDGLYTHFAPPDPIKLLYSEVLGEKGMAVLAEQTIAVAVIDTQWGRNDVLWPALLKFADSIAEPAAARESL